MLALGRDIFTAGSIAAMCYEAADGRLEARYNNLLLSSQFQAIYSLSHRKPIGYEGLLRIRDTEQRMLNPFEFFSGIDSRAERVIVDRLARYLHGSNFALAGGNDAWHFLNVHPDVILHGPSYGSFFKDCLEATGISPNNVVIEILENSIGDLKPLNDAIQYYRDMGCMIAIDDFGAQASNIDRLWQIEPDIVKLDGSLARELDKPSVRRLLPNLVAMIHECGSLVLMEGVETEQQSLMAIDSGVDFVQGYFFARPCKDLWCEAPTACIGEGGSRVAQLCSRYYNYVFDRQRQHEETIQKYILPFETAAREHAFVDTPESFDDILSKSGVERCYILDDKGFQLGDYFLPENHDELFPGRFGIAAIGNGSSWFRRHYYRRAIAQPEKMHYSRPYLSMTAGIICMTFSICLTATDGSVRVYCCDIDWSDR